MINVLYIDRTTAKQNYHNFNNLKKNKGHCQRLLYFLGGDLFDSIAAASKFSEPQARLLIGHLTSAIAYLHSLSIVHRDIKPENLLVRLHLTVIQCNTHDISCNIKLNKFNILFLDPNALP